MVSGRKKTELEHRAGEGETQSLMSMKFPFYKMRKFWRLYNTVNIVSSLEQYT